MGNIGWTNFSSYTFWQRKISSIMGDLAKGIKSFKKGMSDDNSSGNDKSIIQITQILKINNLLCYRLVGDFSYSNNSNFGSWTKEFPIALKKLVLISAN